MTTWKKMVVVGLLVGLTHVAVARAADAPPTRVNLNTASATELARLPGIGAAKAAAIVEFRAKEPFGKPEDLRKVKGIGERLYQSLKDQITVGDAPSRAGRGG
jgi:competence ComEA-like helix-hairpin-helix protein